MSKSPTMDSLLRLLDSQKSSIGGCLLQVTPAEFLSMLRCEEQRIRRRYNALADIVSNEIHGLDDPGLRTKASRVVEALRNTELPARPAEPSREPKAFGRWHHMVEVNKRNQRTGKIDKVEVGVVDYKLTAFWEIPVLDCSMFESAIMVDTSSQTGRNDNRQAFAAWIKAIDVDKCAANEGKRWASRSREDDPVEIYFICLPKIQSLSSAIKKIRVFEESLPKQHVYVCLADPEEAATLNTQGFGTVVFPDGAICGWPFDSAYTPEYQEPDFFHLDWYPEVQCTWSA